MDANINACGKGRCAKRNVMWPWIVRGLTGVLMSRDSWIGSHIGRGYEVGTMAAVGMPDVAVDGRSLT